MASFSLLQEIYFSLCILSENSTFPFSLLNSADAIVMTTHKGPVTFSHLLSVCVSLSLVLRNKETSRDEFIFYSKRLMRLLIEHALTFLPSKVCVICLCVYACSCVCLWVYMWLHKCNFVSSVYVCQC